MDKITVKQGEGKAIKFTISVSGAIQDVSAATFSFVVKEKPDSTTYTIEKADASFDKADGALGIVYLTLGTTDLDIAAGDYVAELKTIFTATTDEDKSQMWQFIVETSLFN